MLGVVLAGGQGRRMGRDKAEVVAGLDPLWRRQVRVLRAAGAERVVVARRRDQAPIDHVDCVFDAFADSGPLAGLHAALSKGGFGWAAVLAVDMPGIDPAWFLWLRGFLSPGRGVVAGHASSLEPLAAIYPEQAFAEVEGRLRRGELSVRRLALDLAAAGRMTVVRVPVGYAARLESLNAPA
jgi:molybdopterin-guanine dinucleotide biosynthesis protein A